MAAYFFHVSHDGTTIEDSDGVNLPSEASAWDAATQACGEMIAEIDGQLAVGKKWQMQVDDETGPLFRITFGATKLR